jgi:creatinine amidohydrolase
MFTWENTWKDFEDNNVTVAVVPMNSTEQHVTNLPLCSDSISVEKIAAELAKELGAYLVPVIPIGESKDFFGFRGTISLSPDTMKSSSLILQIHW